MASGDVGPAASPSSTWAPLKVGVFRGFFLAALTSNVRVKARVYDGTNVFAVKRVPRRINDPLRTYIRRLGGTT